jgi:3'(2'),5'-bisphosphate nucleotidase
MEFNLDHLQTLCHIAQGAGQEIMAVYDQGGAVWQKEDDSPLTEADMRADAVIRRGLEAAFPDVFILSEESRSPGDDSSDTFFLVDPLDGTKEFLKRNGEFTVNIALVKNSEPVMGVVYAPALGELFYAARGVGAFKRSAHGEVRDLQVAPRASHAPLRVIGSRSHGGDKLAQWLDTQHCEYSFIAAGSSLKFCRIAEGQADIYPRLGPTSQWDTAAAQCVLEVAGGAVLDPAGEPLRYGLKQPLLNPQFVALADQEAREIVGDIWC